MVTKVVMPRLSLTMKEGTIGKWYKKEGDSVEKGEPLVELLSEKATYDLEAPASGTLRKILVAEGIDAQVDQLLALIANTGEAFREEEMLDETPAVKAEERPRFLASPAAKRLAGEYGVDLSMVKGSEPGGRITEDDVKQFLESSRGSLPKVKETVALAGFRKTTAERLSMSFRTAPHSTVVMEADFSKIRALRDKSHISYSAAIVKATAKALAEHRNINSSLDGNRIRIFEDVNVGIAVATENGLVVPVIRNADKKSVQEIDKSTEELTTKARQGKLAREELSGGTFTITNLGMWDVEFFAPIINPPEAAILGVGKISDRPAVVNGGVEIKPSVMLSLSYDHRIVDGVPAAQFLQKVKAYLENPESLES